MPGNILNIIKENVTLEVMYQFIVIPYGYTNLLATAVFCNQSFENEDFYFKAEDNRLWYLWQ
jgi:hypothetical protein